MFGQASNSGTISIAEDFLRLAEGDDQLVELGRFVVEVERGARRGGYTQMLHQWLRTVVAGPDGNAVLVEQRGEVVRVDAFQVESEHAAARVRVLGPVQRQIVHLTQPV